MSPVANAAPSKRRRWRVIATLALVIALIVCANLVARWLGYRLDIEMRPSNEHIIHWIIMTSVFVYAILIAIPFVPSVEIGLGLILLLGADLAPLVYLFTVVGLTLSFIVGRLISDGWLQRFLEDLGLKRAGRLIETLRTLSPEQRVSLLVSRAPARFVPVLLRHRYIAVAVALNVPGNTVIGGGGGISLAAGMSRLFRFWPFLLTLAIAVAPVPLLIVLNGTDILR